MTNPTHVYVDLDVFNNDNNSNSEDPILQFYENKNIPYLEGDSSLYYASIIRFSIQTGNSLPVFIPRVQLGQSNPDLTVYKISMKLSMYNYSNNNSLMYSKSYTVPVYYGPTSLVTPKPAAPLVKQDLSSDYYFVKSYRHFCDDLNEAFGVCFQNMKSDQNVLNPNIYNLINTTTAPFFDYDNSTGKFVLSVDLNHVNGVIESLTNNKIIIQIYFNKRLYELLVGFRCIYASATGDMNYLFHYYGSVNTNTNSSLDILPEYANYRLIKYVNGTGDLTTYNAMQYIQEVSSIAMLNPICSLAFVTTMIPIHQTNISAPKDLNSNSNNGLDGSNNLLNIISDFQVAVTSDNQYRGEVVYAPQAEYRLIDLHQSMNLNRVDILCYWKTHYGEFIPVRLSSGNAAHLKIMFRRRDFNGIN